MIEVISAGNLSKVYHSWLQEEVNFTAIENNIIRVDTPFYDRHNESLILYAVPKDGTNLTVTDGGYTLDDLDSKGISITRSEKRRKIFLDQLASYGVKLNEENNYLFVESTVENFPNDKHRLLQAMLFTNDLFFTEKRNCDPDSYVNGD